MEVDRLDTKLTVGILSQWFDPETGPASLPGSLARGLRSRKHSVKVLTAVPNYPVGELYPGYENKKVIERSAEGTEVLRVPIFVSHSKSAVKRALNYLSFAVSASVRGRSALDGADVIWVYNSPPTVLLPLILTKRRTGAPVLLHVMDLWPDSFFATSFSRNPLLKVFRRVFEALTNSMYRRADMVAFISPSVEELLVSRGVDPAKLTYIPTWVESQEPEEHISSSSVLNLDRSGFGRTLVYAGAVGAAQGLDTIIDAMKGMELDLQLAIIGTGTEKERLVARAAGCSNIVFHDPIPQESMHEVYEYADLMLVSLAPSPIAAVSTPSKLQHILHAGQPVLAVGSGDLLSAVDAAEAGVTAEISDPEAVAAALRKVAQSTIREVDRWGVSAKEYATLHYSYEQAIRKVESALLDLNSKLGGKR